MFKKRYSRAVSFFLFFLLLFTTHIAVAKGSEVTVADSGKNGVVAIGGSKGAVKVVRENNYGKILALDFEAGDSSYVGIWTKDFKKTLSPKSVNKITVAVKVLGEDVGDKLRAKLEVKGPAAKQVIPVKIGEEWAEVEKSIDWMRIGSVNEITLIVKPVRGAGKIKGRILFFYKLGYVKPAVSLPYDEIAANSKNSKVYTFFDAMGMGVFNIGESVGNMSKEFLSDVGRRFVRFDFYLPPSTTVGVWSNSYPREINKELADAFAAIVKVDDLNIVKKVALSVEIKGKNGVSSFPIEIGPNGWGILQDEIKWGAIGDLREVVFVVNSASDKSVKGTIHFDFVFKKLTFLEEYFAAVKIGSVLLLSLVIAFIAGFFAKRFVSESSGKEFKKDSVSRDILYGVTAALILAASVIVFKLGSIDRYATLLPSLAVGLLGAVIAGLLKYRVTGKHLTPVEIFQNIFFSGLLAAASSSQAILAVPQSWQQIFLLSKTGASVSFALYHMVNLFVIVNSGKHMRFISASFIVLSPFLLGWLLVLENIDFLKALPFILSLGVLKNGLLAEFMGRFLVVFLFNEILINSISYAMKGRVVKTRKSHIYVTVVSLLVVASPYIANIGSVKAVADLNIFLQAVIVIVTSMFSHLGLWAEVYLLTGVILDASRGLNPSDDTIPWHINEGGRKGMAFAGIFMGLLYGFKIIYTAPFLQSMMNVVPIGLGIVSGALTFPLIKTLIETFDGSQAFFDRAKYSYKNWVLYLRGAVVGFAIAYSIQNGLFEAPMGVRVSFGLKMGLLAGLGISFIRDAVYTLRHCGKIQSWRLYLIDGLLGGFIGSALGFYLDSAQVPVIIEKFNMYTTAGHSPEPYKIYPLVNKWGEITLGSFAGGVKLFFNEALAGVINWSIAAWLFAINRTFMEAFFQKDTRPIKFLFSRDGVVELLKHMVQVLRWGLWMAPIIFSFLRMMADPTWYNQDGAIRTLVAIYKNMTLTPEAFHAWSLNMFILLLANDLVRVLIWIDHMGLRVATLVNLSFIGMNKLDEKIAKFIGPAAAQRYIPEAVKRFTTWAPLLIPFYIPRGNEWDYAWSKSLAIQSEKGGGFLSYIGSLPMWQVFLLLVLVAVAFSLISYVIRYFMRKAAAKQLKSDSIANREYRVVVSENGALYSQLIKEDCDISRRSYDMVDPSGRTLFVVDAEEEENSDKRLWPVIGNFPRDRFLKPEIKKEDGKFVVENEVNGIKTVLTISLPDLDTPVEVWEIKVENKSSESRRLKVVPYLEWVLLRGADDRFHTQYTRLFPEMEYVASSNAVLSWQKKTKVCGLIASEEAPEGFLTSRMDFIGRAKSLWEPRILETFDFLPPEDKSPYPTFDPIGSLIVGVDLTPHESKKLRFVIGGASSRNEALEFIGKFIAPKDGGIPVKKAKRELLIGHGEILPGTPQPYYEYLNDGNTLYVKTPYTTRPYDHAMSNGCGHTVMVTNRGLHTSCNGNSQQNRLTPDWADTVTKEVPSEAIYIYDMNGKEWFSPTHHPLNKKSAKNESEFSVDGSAIFHMTDGDISTELTVFVPMNDPVGVYMLTLRNNSKQDKVFRISPYFQIVLALQPDVAGPLQIKEDKELDALYFRNPRNMFRDGFAFASVSAPVKKKETKRGRFFGSNRGMKYPYFVENGEPDLTQLTDDRPVAAFLSEVEVPSEGEATIAIVLGQTDKLSDAKKIISKYKDLDNVYAELENVRSWWLSLMETVKIKTNNKEFDYLQNWLKYQALAERIWARRGFYQTSGAFGFRDQLQDTVNLILMDPKLARKQIILHASHQFLEGDVFHWFFLLTDGRTSFACRSHASDNLLWLVWGVVEYVRMTGDESILDEMTSYVKSELPFQPLPKNKHGLGDFYHRATRADTIYKHCMRSIDLVFNKRMGMHGLPLIGTGDWNDGLDEIGSEGRGESVWLGFFLSYILNYMIPIIGKREGDAKKSYYVEKHKKLKEALEATWRDDRYLRAIHDDGTEIGVADSGIWETDALTAAWAVMSGINPEREEIVFHTALRVLERDNVILLGYPPLREDSKPYLGRSSHYPEGVRENGMYCHGVQWLIKAARILAERHENGGNKAKAKEYREIAYRLWLKITPVSHVKGKEIEVYGGQPNKQPADILTTFEPGRMIWNGYTGAAGWLFRESFEGVAGVVLEYNELVIPDDINEHRGKLKVEEVSRNVSGSPIRI